MGKLSERYSVNLTSFFSVFFFSLARISFVESVNPLGSSEPWIFFL